MTTQKFTKHYIEHILIKKSQMGYEETRIIEQINEKNPLLYPRTKENEKGFIFFDITITKLNNGQEINGPRENISPTFFYGTRLTENDIINNYPYLQSLGFHNIIKCDCGCYARSNKEDITIEEYKKTLSSSKKTKKKKII